MRTIDRVHLLLAPLALLLVVALAPGCTAIGDEPQSQGRGTRVCDDNGECGEGEFCRKKLGKCDKKGKCEARPDLCASVFDPVCGCDGNTYPNECSAWIVGVSAASAGECEGEAGTCTGNADCASTEYCSKPVGDCDGSGSCEARPEACIQIYDPVCGCDGRTYGNGCTAASAGQSLESADACDAPTG